MTTHEGLPVAGYRAQPDRNVKLVNRNKNVEERTLRILDELAALAKEEPRAIDGRWLAIGRTHIEQGFMAVNRAVFQPSRVVTLPEDPPPGL